MEMSSSSAVTWFQNLSPQEKIQAAIAELKRRGVRVDDDRCIRCTTDQFNADILDIPVTSAVSMRFFIPPPPNKYWTTQITPTGSISVLAVVCRNCGYTIFHNLNALGLA